MANSFQCEIIPLPRIYDLCSKLSQKILDSNFKVDVVIAIARGGFVPARLICDFLDINNLTSLKVRHYTATDKGEKARLQYPLNADIKGLNVLLVDDVNDTGKSIKVAMDHLQSLGPASVKVAVMHEKKGSLIESDYYIEYLKKWRWLIYEWAVVEDVGSFIEKSDCKTLSACIHMLKIEYGIELDAVYLKRILPFIKTKISED